TTAACRSRAWASPRGQSGGHPRNRIFVGRREERGIRRTLPAAQVRSRTVVEAPGLAGRQLFSSHLWFFGPLPVKRLLTGSPGGPPCASRPTRRRSAGCWTAG